MDAAVMLTVTQALDSLEEVRLARPDVRTTGFAALDRASGGFERGQVWIIVGTPGQGRSTIASQWAWLLASEHGFTTQLVSMKDPATRMAARITSAVAKVPQNHLWRDGLSSIDDEKMLLTRSRLESAPFLIVGPDDLSIAVGDLAELPVPGVLVVDDAHRVGGMCPQRTAALAARGLIVVLTLPRDRVVSDDAGIDPEWAEVADFILEIDRPDLLDRASIRPGEAELHLVRNRWGPSQNYVVAFQGHYARFVEMA